MNYFSKKRNQAQKKAFYTHKQGCKHETEVEQVLIPAKTRVSGQRKRQMGYDEARRTDKDAFASALRWGVLLHASVNSFAQVRSDMCRVMRTAALSWRSQIKVADLLQVSVKWYSI